MNGICRTSKGPTSHSEARGLRPALRLALTACLLSCGAYMHAASTWISTTPPRSRDILFSLPTYHTLFGKNNDHIVGFYSRTNQIGKPFEDRFSGDAFSTFATQLAQRSNNPQLAATTLKNTFRNLSFYEQKAGGVFSCSRTIENRFFWKLDIPLYLSALNFNLHSEDKKLLEGTLQEIVADQPIDDESPTSKALMSLITKSSAKWGVSDIRLTTGVKAISKQNELMLGSELIIPVSSWFRPKRGYLPLGGKKLLTVTNSLGLASDLSTVIDQVRLVSIHPTLGNNGHWGMGGYFSLKLPIVQRFCDFWNLARVTHFFPGTQYRILNLTDAAPCEFKMNSAPGDIVHLLQAFDFSFDSTKISIGYDLFMQGKEKLVTALDFDTVIANEVDPITTTAPWLITRNQLNLPDNQRPNVMQHKIFCALTQSQTDNGVTLSFSMGGDIAINAESIGKNFSVFLFFEACF